MFTIATAAVAITIVGAIIHPPFKLTRFHTATSPITPIMDTVKVLINVEYGGIDFSDLFCAEYDKIYGSGSAHAFIYTELYDPAFSDSEYYNPNISTRYDHKMIELYERLGGSAACSGKHAVLRTVELPRVLAPYIHITEYDGAETLKIHLSRMYRDLLDEIIQRRSVRFVDVLAHEEIRGWERYLTEKKIGVF